MSRALVAAINMPAGGRAIFNLAGAQGYTLNQLVSIIGKALNVDIEVKYMAARKFDVQRLHLDTSMATKILNWQPEITLTDGIQRTAEWIKKWIH
jgi:nucleoside-diphosphate-sugar epimerase